MIKPPTSLPPIHATKHRSIHIFDLLDTLDMVLSYFAAFGRTFSPFARVPGDAHWRDTHFEVFRLIFGLTERKRN